MLANQMPEIPFTPATGDLQRFEAFAYVCLASYNDQAITANVQLSFQRAFDVATLQMTARVAGGRPGFCLASYSGKPQPKLIVAIEGTTDRAQIIDLWGVNARIGVGGTAGFVFAPFANHADTIFTALMANPIFTAARDAASVPIIFTGHSLGAAIAEILAVRVKTAFPTKPVKCIKFASPRVGTAEWVANRHPGVFRDAVYFERDPIDLFPFTTPGVPGLASATPVFNTIQWANGREGTRLSIEPRRTPLPTIHEGSYGASMQAAFEIGRTVDRFNSWFDHDKWRYYLGFMMNDWGNRNWNLATRMLYLEFNDRNVFGQRWLGEPIATPAMETFADPAPSPYLHFFRDDELLAMNQSLINAGADPRALDPRETRTAPGGVARSTGGIEPVIPRVREIVAPRPPTFVYPASGRRRR